MRVRLELRPNRCANLERFPVSISLNVRKKDTPSGFVNHFPPMLEAT